MSRWFVFIQERFNLAVYIPVILLFVASHASLAGNNSYTTAADLFFICVAVVIFFFILRLFDEVKDYEFDSMYHPGRPLPRQRMSAGW